MSGIVNRGFFWLGILAALTLAACGSNPLNQAPVEDRGASGSAAPAVSTAVKPPPGFENAGKPGYYTVKPGDTLIRISLESGQSPKDITRWNALENPNRIEVGQVLRIVPPVTESAAVVKPISSGNVTTTPIANAATAAKPAPEPAAAKPPAAAASDSEISFIWPSNGPVIAGFDPDKNNKGLDIAGAAGDPVLASADAKVVYAGAGLRGYGNLIILKHNNSYITAYAHNQTLLVKEDQTVKQGQKIAEMGNTDSDRVKLHFEVRRQNLPVDPLKYLPAK